MDFDRKKLVTLFLVALIIFGLLGLPPLLQHLYGINAVKTAFAVIIVYFAISLYLKRRGREV